MSKKEILFGLSVALVLAGLLSLFASSSPDGLERVAADQEFLEKGEGPPVLPAPLPDYVCPGFKSERLATSVAGLLGTLVVFGLGYGLALLLKRKKIR